MPSPAGLWRGIPRIQIAGIKNVEEAALSTAAGADGIGLLLALDYPRDDAITPNTAMEIVRSLPKDICSVLITHSIDVGEIVRLARLTGVSAVQIHTDPALEISCSALSSIRSALPDTGIIKVLHIPARGEETPPVSLPKEVAGLVDALILDSQAVEVIDGQTYKTLGGTGRLNDWGVAVGIVAAVAPLPVLHAGGLNPDNVFDAIRRINPYGVDVNSGVRKEGSCEKDPARVGTFVRQAKAAFAKT